MIKRILPIVIVAVIFSLGACAEPQKYTNRKVPPCTAAGTKNLGVPYVRLSDSSCATGITPFDVAVWTEAPMNSHKVRSVPTIELGCKPLTVASDNCDYSGVPGHSNTLMVNFDPSVYSEDITVRRAVLAVYSPNNPQGLNNAILRGRLNVGDELQSLARQREGMVGVNNKQITDGWIFFDVSSFVARAINERRNSIQFEVSVLCQTPATNLVTVGVAQKSPRLVVEYN